MQKYLSLLSFIPAVFAKQALVFAPPAGGPLQTSTNYVGQSNGSLSCQPVVPGKVFDRVIFVWYENTNFDDAHTTPVFRDLESQGILLDQYYSLTHPSEPEYVASVGGDFWGMADDDFYNIPANISTIVDLLEEKNISWASYQENMPTDGFQGFSFSSMNYVNTSAANYTYYVRKHNPLIVFDSIASVPSRLARHRNFNDFALDVNASCLPQWMFITPNLVNDAHDTSIDFAANWTQYFISPLLENPSFNGNKTLIVLTFDENESSSENNRIWTLLLGNAVPENLRGTVDSTYYTHYSSLSTVEVNWGLGCLGRGDVNKTMANVYGLVANATGYQNTNITGDAIPLTNASGIYPGPLNPDAYFPFLAPDDMNVACPGGGKMFIAPGLNISLTRATAPAPINLTALNLTVPASGPIKSSQADSGSNSSSNPSSPSSQSGAAEYYSIKSSLVGSVILAGLFMVIA